MSVHQQEQVGWLEISMTNTDRLQVTQGGNDRHNHLFELILLPVRALLLSLSEQVLQVGATVHVLTHHCDPVSVVHRLVEVVSEELKDIWVTLNLEQLHSFFLYAADKMNEGQCSAVDQPWMEK